MADTPLETVKGWSPDHVARMKEAWVTTAEQVVALGATKNGMDSLSQHLRLSVEEVRRLVELAMSQLSPRTGAEMEHPSDTSDYGLGALPPENVEKRR